MFDWLRRRLLKSAGNDRQQFFAKIDTLNAEAGGGEPVVVSKTLGSLKLRSRILTLADPMYVQVPRLDVPNLVTDEVEFFALLRQYPSGTATVEELSVRLGEGEPGGCRRKIGEVAIDSAKLVVADKADIDEHWTEVGRDRIGVILTPRDDTVIRLLKRRFKLKTVQVHAIRHEVVGRVSEDLEAEIEAWLKSKPKYAEHPFMHFRVQTNNSFDRANFMEKPWDFIPIGNADAPLMFVCQTGRGDGVYDVECEFASNIPRVLTIRFIDEEDGAFN
jgi:hypothetical protein